jgi:hypothetical protein
LKKLQMIANAQLSPVGGGETGKVKRTELKYDVY